jgi:hypothetical protein
MGFPAFTGCTKGSYCSDKAMTPVGDDKTNIYHRTVTTLTGQGPAYTGSKTETYIIKPKPGGPLGTMDQWVLAATSTDGGKTQTFTDDAGADLKKSLSPGGNMYKNVQAQVQTTLTTGGKNQRVIQLPGESGSLEKIKPEQQKSLGIIPQSTATNPEDSKPAAGGLTAGSTEDKALTESASKYIGRQKYGDVKYPEYLKSEKQDCIKFTIIKYNPSTLATTNISQRNVGFLPNKPNSDGIVEGTNRIILGSITLPIPGNITDRNNADWQKSDLSVINEVMANTMNSAILSGGEAGKNAAEQGVKSISSDTNLLKGFAAAKITENALGTSNLLARQYGAVTNPNAELLFNGPSLRDFSFTFKMSPRSPEEAKDVRTIIRYFKQAMSTKRTESVLLLRSPHTFAISYLSGNKEHPYLNKFKECALTGCSVNYTPYGSYMTYNGDQKSMVAYELSLTFQELEPVFDDDYGVDSDIPTYIGY